MEKEINVLWVDDEHDEPEMIPFIIEAEGESLILHGHASYEEAFEELEDNLTYFDVILLDGLFYEKRNQVKGTEDESGIGMALAKINELKSKKFFPWFVLSGKDSFTKKENSILKANKAKCFDKTNPEDIVKLFSTIKKAAQNQPDVELKNKYRKVMEVCSPEYIGPKHFSRIFGMIKDLESSKVDRTQDLLNPIRKVVEAVFIRFGDLGIIPKEVLNNSGWITRSSLFLACKHNEYIYKTELTNPVVGENFYRLLNIIQDGSHGDGNLTLGVDKYLSESTSDYLYKSCLYCLFDIVVWFKDYIDNNPNEEENQGKWERKESWIYGKVQKVENGWGTFEPDVGQGTVSILPLMVQEHKLEINTMIKVITQPSKDGKKTHIKTISKIF